jgi:large subunit ribosomal protein L25
MAETIELTATSRTVVGKASKRLAATGRLPGVVYGASIEAKPIEVDRHTFEQMLAHEALTTSLVHLIVDDHKPVNVIVKEIVRDPVKGTIQHVDFWAIKMTQQITTTVPIHYVGESPGVKAGGVITHNLRELSVEALPTQLPENIEADISALEIGDSLHVGQLPVPEGVVIHISPDEIVASVLAPKAAEVEEVEGEVTEEAEPEVIGEKAEESSEE